MKSARILLQEYLPHFNIVEQKSFEVLKLVFMVIHFVYQNFSFELCHITLQYYQTLCFIFQYNNVY